MRKQRTMRIFFVASLLLACCLSLPVTKYEHQRIIQHLSFIKHPSVACTICKRTVEVVHLLMKAGVGKGFLETAANQICRTLRMQTDRVCAMGVRQFGNEVWQLLAQSLFQPRQICSVLGNHCSKKIKFLKSWNVTIPKRTRTTPSTSHIGLKTGDGPPVKVLHLSDTHLDDEYQEGSVAQCPEPLCCRFNDGMAREGEPAAGKYGYVGFCDTNLLTFHTMLQHIKDNHNDMKYIMYTGDVPAHDVWNQTRKGQEDDIRTSTDFFKQYFPGKKVYPTLGNHEGVPVNSFPPPEIWDWSVPTTEWLFDFVAEQWGAWLPEECKETIKKGGYYTTLIEKGLRIVSLNTNYGHFDNWWLSLHNHDPAGQLKWLVQILLQAEKSGEKVHIIGHTPPGSRLYWWDFNYYNIVDRFRHTVTGQFYGHTHHDEFRLFYDTKHYKTPTNIAYLAPSVTTYHDLNPGYRIYEMDIGSANSSKSVINHKTFILDIQKANSRNGADFQLEYTAKEDYNLKDLSPLSWNEFLARIMENEKLFQVLFRAYYKQNPTYVCDVPCRKRFACVMKRGRSGHDFCNMTEEENDMFSAWEAKTYSKC